MVQQIDVIAPAGDRAVGSPNENDGRRLRRDRNRTAVIDALVALMEQGNLNPSSSEVAERAGLSARSLFRYFTDIDDLTSTAFEVLRDRARPLAEISLSTAAPLPQRIEALARSRMALFEAIGAGGIVSRTRAPFNARVAEELREGRRMLRDQVAKLFAPELEARGDSAPTTLAMVDIIASYEAYVLLRDDQGLEPSERFEATRSALSALLTP